MSAPRGLNPLQLPAPPGFGSLGDLRVPGNYDFAYQGNPVPEFDPPLAPERIEQATAFPKGPGVPDLLRVQYGAGNRDIVGDLLRIVEGQEPQNLRGISPQVAQKYLNDWGYPNKMNDWSAEEWASALDAHALDFNPLELFGLGYSQGGSRG